MITKCRDVTDARTASKCLTLGFLAGHALHPKGTLDVVEDTHSDVFLMLWIPSGCRYGR